MSKFPEGEQMSKFPEGALTKREQLIRLLEKAYRTKTPIRVYATTNHHFNSYSPSSVRLKKAWLDEYSSIGKTFLRTKMRQKGDATSLNLNLRGLPPAKTKSRRSFIGFFFTNYFLAYGQHLRDLEQAEKVSK